jgi:hypothetical protein
VSAVVAVLAGTFVVTSIVVIGAASLVGGEGRSPAAVRPTRGRRTR